MSARWIALFSLVLATACEPLSPPDAGSDDASTGDSGQDADTEDASLVDAGATPPLTILVFTRTNGFRHPSIANGLTAFSEMAAGRGWALETTDTPASFTGASLADIDVLVFLNTTGTLFEDDSQRAALESWVRGGGGWVGIHAAADAEYSWPWYGELVGTWFSSHPPGTEQARLITEDRTHPTTNHLDATWVRTDEWYDFRSNPRPNVDVLITIDESTYDDRPGGVDHPMTWVREIDAGRSFYTALGHTPETYSEPEFREMIAQAIEWVAR